MRGGDGTDSGRVDAQSGQHVLLSLNGSTIEGRTETGHDLVFTVQVDGSGNVTFTEDRSVKEPNPNDANDTVTMTSGLVSLTATITDNDGDHASSSLDISQKLVFRDDAPTITVSGTAPTLTVDESFLTSATNGINGTTRNSAQTHTSGSFANDFVSNPGADGQSGSIAYALSINGGTNPDSGLVDAQTGQHV